MLVSSDWDPTPRSILQIRAPYQATDPVYITISAGAEQTGPAFTVAEMHQFLGECNDDTPVLLSWRETVYPVTAIAFSPHPAVWLLAGTPRSVGKSAAWSRLLAAFQR